MILYHGNNTIVRQPLITEPNRTLDYGSGFYTTRAEKQAWDWAKRKIKTTNRTCYVNVYEFDEKALKELKVLWFDNPSDEWVDFVMRNRQDETYRHETTIWYTDPSPTIMYTCSLACMNKALYPKTRY